MQIIHGEEYYENSQYKVVLNKKIPVARGNILDRNGVPIAVNRVGYNVDIVNARLEEQELNSMLLKLYEIFERNGDNFNKSFTRYLTFEPFAFGSEAKKSSKAFQNGLQIIELRLNLVICQIIAVIVAAVMKATVVIAIIIVKIVTIVIAKIKMPIAIMMMIKEMIAAIMTTMITKVEVARISITRIIVMRIAMMGVTTAKMKVAKMAVTMMEAAMIIMIPMI